MPDPPDNPGVDRRIGDPRVFCFGAGSGVFDDVLAQRTDHGNVAGAPRHIFPETGLSRSLNDDDPVPRPHDIAQSADSLGIAGANEDVRDAEIERVDRLLVNLAVHRLDEVGHHVFGAAVQDVGVLLGLFDPFLGRAGDDADLGSRARAIDHRCFLHRRRGAAWAVDVQDFGICRGSQRQN